MHIAIVSGGFDPLHSGHVALIQDAARRVSGPVIVVLNSDAWLLRKKGRLLMPWAERAAVVGAMREVLDVVEACDQDGTVVQSLAALTLRFPYEILHFCNGGDRGDTTTPEMEFCREVGITSEFGVGGPKTQSSSWLLARYTGERS